MNCPNCRHKLEPNYMGGTWDGRHKIFSYVCFNHTPALDIIIQQFSANDIRILLFDTLRGQLKQARLRAREDGKR